MMGQSRNRTCISLDTDSNWTHGENGSVRTRSLQKSPTLFPERLSMALRRLDRGFEEGVDGLEGAV